MKKFKERLPRLCAAMTALVYAKMTARFCAALLCAALLVSVASCSNASGGAALPTAPGGSPAGTPGENNARQAPPPVLKLPLRPQPTKAMSGLLTQSQARAALPSRFPLRESSRCPQATLQCPQALLWALTQIFQILQAQFRP